MDLFAFDPAPKPAPPRQDANSYMAETMPLRRVAPTPPAPPAPEPVRFESTQPARISAIHPSGPRRVVSLACYCGCQDEVRQPAPPEILCWGCKKPMRRWEPIHEPPFNSARAVQ